MACWFLLVLGK